MSFNENVFEWVTSLSAYGIIVAITTLIALVIAIAISLASFGTRGPGKVFRGIGRMIVDFIFISYRRVFTIANLTFKEALRKKALSVFVVFAILFMFAGWFLNNAGPRSDLQMGVYVIFVFRAMAWLVLPVLLLLACWGIPSDIKDRSLHTVTTKPVRKSEILLGRFLGYSFVGTIVLFIMGTVGYVWILRIVPEDAQTQLISRVPVYGEMTFASIDNRHQKRGISIGDEWSFRSYLAGGTSARAYYSYKNIDVGALKKNYEQEIAQLKQAKTKAIAAAKDADKKSVEQQYDKKIASTPALRLEYNFLAYRSQKGILERKLRAHLILTNTYSGLEVPLPMFEVNEHSQRVEDKVREVPLIISYREKNSNKLKTAHLFDDIINKGRLQIEVEAVDAHQYLGMAKPDLFIHMPHRSFATSYFKSLFGLWMQMILVIVIGVMMSCFVKGPVATLATFIIYLVGFVFRGIMEGLLKPPEQHEGGLKTIHGPFETAYRMMEHSSAARTIKSTPWVDFAWYLQQMDSGVMGILWVVQFLIPDFSRFNMNEYTAKGFDVPLQSSLLPGMAITFAFIIPCLVIGYFSLQFREMESK